MLQNAYFVAKIGADTAENEQHFAEMLPKHPLAGLAANVCWGGGSGAGRRKEGLCVGEIHILTATCRAPTRFASHVRNASCTIPQVLDLSRMLQPGSF